LPQTSQTNSDRLWHVVVLRAIAILLVVIGHSPTNPIAGSSNGVPALIQTIFVSYPYSFHMPLFLWMSGYVFFYSSFEQRQDIHVTRELIKKGKRLLVPLYATGFLVLLPTTFLLLNPEGSFLRIATDILLTKDIQHLWFLRSLFCIFLVFVPFYHYLKKINGIVASFLCAGLLTVHLSGAVAPFFARDILLFFFGWLTRKFWRDFCDQHTLRNALILCLIHLSLFLFSPAVTGKLFGVVFYYFKALAGVYYIYFTAIYISRCNLPAYLRACFGVLERGSFTIYLFHITFIAITYGVFRHYAPDAGAAIMTVVAFVTGTLLPLAVHTLLTRSRLLSFLFAVPYKMSGGGRL